MCGIAGIWFKQPQRHEKMSHSIEKMLSSMVHRGPDDGGYSVGERVALGNRRLSIFDLSSAGNQPFFSSDGRISLVLNGEIYNHRELRKELEGEFDFFSNTDTEVLLYAYEKWGVECLHRLNGMFAIAIWDERGQELVLCRDRVGIKPLYYYYDGSSCVFGSEIKSLLAGGVTPQVNMPVLKDYLSEGFYDHTNETFFKNIRQVGQGNYLIINDSKLTEKSYWNLKTSFIDESYENVEEEYWDVLRDSVRLRMRADVPYAVMLSGGLDSSIIAHLADQSIPGKQLHVCTFRHDDPKYDEGPWADLVARGKGWKQHDIVLTEKHVTDLLPLALWHQDEPFGSVATFADMLLAKEARKNGIFVLLEGQGADETLGGYEYYYNYYLSDLAQQNLGKARELHREYAHLRNIDPHLVEEQFQYLIKHPPKLSGGIGQDGTVSTMSKVLSGSMLKQKGTKWNLDVSQGRSFENCLYRDLTKTKVPRVLRFKDKASMMHGVELRVPFLDHRLLELSSRIPAKNMLVKGYTKYCLRKKMRGLLPNETCFHVKRQVQTPQREWLRGLLRPMVEEVIYSESFASRGLFDVNKVQGIYTDYLQNPSRYQNLFFIWQWLQVEWWLRIFFDKTIETNSSMEWAIKENHLRTPRGLSS